MPCHCSPATLSCQPLASPDLTQAGDRSEPKLALLLAVGAVFRACFFSLSVLCRVSCLLLGPDALQVTVKHLCWLQLPEKYWSLFQVLCLQAGANALSATYTKQRRLTISLYFSLGPSASGDLALELLFLCPRGLA